MNARNASNLDRRSFLSGLAAGAAAAVAAPRALGEKAAPKRWRMKLATSSIHYTVLPIEQEQRLSVEKLRLRCGSLGRGAIGHCHRCDTGTEVGTAQPAGIRQHPHLVANFFHAGFPKRRIGTRIYVTDIGRWEEVGRAHGEFFADVMPATSMIEVSGLIDARMIVEVEADAYVSADRD